jgi:prophage DNA circulation protein
MSRKAIDAIYTSPSGKEAPFLCETVSRKTELKTGVFTFPSRDGAHVQHQGMGARSFPLTCIFSGSNCMDDADTFETMLIERGIGELQHPVYGTIKVIPTGEIVREDDLVTGINESIVTITFTETITGETSAELNAVAADDIDEKYNKFAEESATDFAEGIDDKAIEEPATQWQGKVRSPEMDISEKEAVTLPAGTELESATTGKVYITEESVDLDNVAPDDETEFIRVKCTETGEAGNLNSGEVLEFVEPIESVDKYTTVESVTAYGTDGISIAGNKSVSEQLKIQSNLNMQTQSIIDNLQSLAMSDKKTFADWLAIAKEVKDNIKNLYKKVANTAGKIESVYAKALNIARGTLRLMKLPSRIAISLAEKIKGYSKLTADLINQYKNDPFGIKNVVNAYTTAVMAVSGALASIASGSAIAVAETGASGASKNIKGMPKAVDRDSSVTSREDTVESARAIMRLFDDMADFQDTRITQIELAGESTLQVTQIIEETINFEKTNIVVLEGLLPSVPPSIKLLIKELLFFKNEKEVELQESIGKPASRAIDILNDIIFFEYNIIARLKVLSGAQDVIQILEDSIPIENENIDALQIAAGKINNTFVDSNSETFLLLSELVYTSLQLILNASFALPMQRTITLDRDRQVLELCAEVYGSVEPEVIDRFIMENNFNIDEIQLIPMGRKVSYYVQSA